MRRATLTAVLSSTLALAACCDAPASHVLAVPLRAQETSLWCWAASGQMTMNFIHPASNVQQGDEANRRLGRADCLNSPVPAACIRTGWPEYEKYDFTPTRTSDTALSWDQLRDEIGCAGRPFAFTWHWPRGGGHMMVAIGYKVENGQNWVLVNDPLPETPGAGTQSWMLYDRYVGGGIYSHTHWDDFYQIRYTGN